MGGGAWQAHGSPADSSHSTTGVHVQPGAHRTSETEEVEFRAPSGAADTLAAKSNTKAHGRVSDTHSDTPLYHGRHQDYVCPLFGFSLKPSFFLNDYRPKGICWFVIRNAGFSFILDPYIKPVQTSELGDAAELGNPLGIRGELSSTDKLNPDDLFKTGVFTDQLQSWRSGPWCQHINLISESSENQNFYSFLSKYKNHEYKSELGTKKMTLWISIFTIPDVYPHNKHTEISV